MNRQKTGIQQTFGLYCVTMSCLYEMDFLIQHLFITINLVFSGCACFELRFLFFIILNSEINNKLSRLRSLRKKNSQQELKLYSSFHQGNCFYSQNLPPAIWPHGPS